MKRRVPFGILLTVALVSSACHQMTASSVAGQWAPQRAELGGQPFAVRNFAGATLRLTADSYEFAGDKGTFAVLSAGAPARMDIHGVEGPNAGRTIPAIFRLAGDQLTICYQLGTGERPTEFSSPKDTKVFLVHYQRVH